MQDKENVLVTGGAGFIGSHLVERLLGEGHTVTVIDDCSTGRPENLQAVAGNKRLRFIRAKISECGELPAILERADAVYHLAAAVGVDLVVSSPIHVLTNNFHETAALLAAAAPVKAPVLLTSTSEVYGKSQRPAFSEDDDLLIGPPSHSRWSYACSKLLDEFMALAYGKERGLPVIIARLFNTVGPRQTGRFGMVLPRFIEAAKAGRPLRVYGDGRQTRCFCAVQETVEALVRLQRTSAARGEVFNVGGEQETSILDLAHEVVAALDSRSAVELVPYDEAYAPGFEDMTRRRPVVEKLFRTVQYRPTASLREIIKLAAAS